MARAVKSIGETAVEVEVWATQNVEGEMSESFTLEQGMAQGSPI